MTKNDVDEKGSAWLLAGVVPLRAFGLLVAGVFMGLVYFAGTVYFFSRYEWAKKLMEDPSPEFWFLVILAYVLGAVAAGCSAVRFAFVGDWKFYVLLIIFAAVSLISYVTVSDPDMSLARIIIGVAQMFKENIQYLLWPVAVVILIITFRGNIRSRLAQVKKIDAFGVRAEFSGERPPAVAVTSFKDLMGAISDLIRKAGKKDKIRFTAYTPALGYLAKTKHEWDELHRLLARNLHRISMTCLEERDLETWHDRFQDKVTDYGTVITGTLTKQATKVSEKLLKFARLKDLKRKRFADLPECYLFASENRSIVVVPFYVPKLEGEKTKDPPSMVGFVTNERRIVQMIQDAHDKIHAAPPSSGWAVTCFKELIVAVSELIVSAGHKDTIRITAHTLALDYLAQIKGERDAKGEWEESEKLKELLAGNLHRMSITCLPGDQVKEWMRSGGVVRDDLIKGATNFLDGLLRSPNDVERRDLGKFPEYYLFASQERAIFVWPFFVPKPRRAPANNKVTSWERSSLVGFVMKDPTMRAMIQTEHDLLHKDKKFADLFKETIDERMSQKLALPTS